jgi:hypothetical protein
MEVTFWFVAQIRPDTRALVGSIDPTEIALSLGGAAAVTKSDQVVDVVVP